MTLRLHSLRRALVWVLACGQLFLAGAAFSQKLYRYSDAQGKVVVDFQVPADRISLGYEVLNSKGMVVNVVPRELTEEELESQEMTEKLRREAVAEQQRLRDWDESLMLRYSTIEDIKDAQRRGLGNLEIRLSILRGNRRSLKQEVENYQTQAADKERAGHEVEVEWLRKIEDLRGEIVNVDKDIAKRQQEIREISGEYDADIKRFRMLLDVVELRRNLSAERASSPR
jgi:hypothetical protein